MLNKILCLFNVLYALNVEGMYYIIKRFIYSIDNFDQFIINVCERLKNKNVFYVKAIQAASSNNELFSKQVRDYMKIMADKVPYKSNEYDIDNLKKILDDKHITLDEKPVSSGTISIVFKACGNDKKYAIKYKRDNVDKHITNSIDEMKLSLPFEDEDKNVLLKEIEEAYYAIGKIYIQKLNEIKKGVEIYNNFLERFNSSNYLTTPLNALRYSFCISSSSISNILAKTSSTFFLDE